MTGGQSTVALRAPAHPVARALLAAFGRGIAAPSANRYGRISPTRAADVREELGGRVALVLDGGDCEVGLESTIVACLGGRVTLLRPGSVSRSQVADVVGAVDDPDASSPRAPGRQRSHYAPGTPLEVVAPPVLRQAVDAAIARGRARRRAGAQRRAGCFRSKWCGDRCRKHRHPMAARFMQRFAGSMRRARTGSWWKPCRTAKTGRP